MGINPVFECWTFLGFLFSMSSSTCRLKQGRKNPIGSVVIGRWASRRFWGYETTDYYTFWLIKSTECPPPLSPLFTIVNNIRSPSEFIPTLCFSVVLWSVYLLQSTLPLPNYAYYLYQTFICWLLLLLFRSSKLRKNIIKTHPTYYSILHLSVRNGSAFCIKAN